jgi:hypothetical protein
MDKVCPLLIPVARNKQLAHVLRWISATASWIAAIAKPNWGSLETLGLQIYQGLVLGGSWFRFFYFDLFLVPRCRTCNCTLLVILCCICWPICVQESPHVTTKKISMSILHSELNPVDIQDTWHWPSTDFNWHWPTVMIKATATWYWPSRLQDNSWFIIPAVEPTSFHWIHPNSPAQALLRLLQYVAVATFQTYDILYYRTLW